MLPLLVTITGCYCFRYEYVSFEDQADFVVTEETTRPMGGAARVFPSVPTHYTVKRVNYVLYVSTGGDPYPILEIRAFDTANNPLEISGSDMASRFGPRIPKGIESGAWAFDVFRDGPKVGRESFHYEIRSRDIACDLKK